MADDKNIDVLRVEVLDNDVQKYSSTTVSGGGGHVAVVNGAVIGRAEAIHSEINHHVSQDIWVKDLSSGREMQLSLTDVLIPVRSGHHLWIAYDHESEKWERIVNESTGESTYGNGFTNPVFAAQLRYQAKLALLSPILLIIPLLNFLGGIAALALLVRIPVNLSNKTIPGNRAKILKALVVGIVLFFSSYWAAMSVSARDTSFFMNIISLTVTAVLATTFARTCRASYIAAANMISERSQKIDSVLQQARSM